MTQKQKEHRNIAIAVLAVVHLLFCYSEGGLNPMSFTKDARDYEIMMILISQAFAHYFWINREKITKELKDE